MLAGICQYQGDATTLQRALLDCQLLDEPPAGEFEVHGWAEKNAMLLNSWDNGGKGGRPAKNPRVNPDPKSGNPRVNPDGDFRNPPVNPDPQSGNPRATHGVTDRKKEGRDRLDGEDGGDRLEGEEGGSAPDGGFRPIKISWSAEQGWTGFTPEIRGSLAKAFPGIDLDLACIESDAWLREKPGNAKKKNWFGFLTNWLRRSSPSGGANPEEGTSQNHAQKNEGGDGPPAQLVRPAPAGPWRGAFEATYSRCPGGAWADLPPAIQREIRAILAAADPLQIAAWEAFEKNEGGIAA